MRILSFDDLSEKPIPWIGEIYKSYQVAKALQKKLGTLQPGVVFFNGMYGWALPKKTPYLKIGLCHGTFASFARHAMPWRADRIRTQFGYAHFEKKSFENADVIISNSSFTRRILQEDYHLDSLVIPPGIDFDIFHEQNKENAKQRLGFPLQKKIILFVGRPDYYKGFDWVEKIAQMRPDWQVVSVTFPKASSRCVDCRAPVPNTRLVDYYSAADAVFFPSRFESFGLVTLEALSCQRPVVTSPFGLAQELLHPLLFTVDEPTVPNYIAALEHAIQISTPTFPDLRSRYGLEAFVNTYRQTIQSLLSKKA